MAVVKSGCLHRISTILRRWKKNWFDLYLDGRLVFYNDQQRRDMEDDIHMKIDCINIRSSAACQDLNPPEGKMRDSLLQIVCRDGRVISLCADSADDALAWTEAFQDAWINMVYTAALPTQIVYDGEPYAVTYSSQYQGGSMAPGAGVKDIIMREQQSDNGEDTATEQQSDNDEDTATEQQSDNSEDTTTEQQSDNSEDTTAEQKRDRGADMALGVLMGAATGLAIASLFSVL